MYSCDELREIYSRLAEPFPEEAVERTKAAVTRKGYDTTGIKYQYVVNRLNEVLGVGGFRVQREFALREKQTRNGYPMVEATCDIVMQLGQWVEGEFLPFAESTGTGGHTSSNEADAKKGAFTNGLKKVAAMFGCGWQAYAGVIDDDNVPAGVHQTEPAPARGRTKSTKPAARRGSSRAGTANGRVTSAQLAKMRELVDEVGGGDWGRFREHIRNMHDVNPEYLSKHAASGVIESLLSSVRRKRGNGANGSARTG